MNLTPDDPKLTAYALGELDATERAAVEAALTRSPECRRAVAEIRALGVELATSLAADTATALGTLPSLATDSSAGCQPAVSADWQSAGRDSGQRPADCQSAKQRTDSLRYGAEAQAARSSQGEGADAPGEGKVIFLPWRHWRTLGMAAAAALVVGFIVAKVWLPKPTEQMAKEDMSLPAARAKSLSVATPTNTNQTPTISDLHISLHSTSSSKILLLPNASTAPVTLQFSATDGLAVAGKDSKNANGNVLTVPGDRNQLNNTKADFGLGASPTIYSVNAVGFVQVEPGVGFQATSDPTKSPASGKNVITVGAADYFRLATKPGQSAVAWSDSTKQVGLVDAGLDPATGQNRFYARYAYTVDGEQLEKLRQNWAFQPDNRWVGRLESPNSTAAYPRFVENPFTLVASEPLSTFSTDVDTASYANVRRFLNQNQLPPRDAVRIEELLNYFTYDYAPPTGEHPFAAHIEVAGCPWAPEHRLVRVGLKGRELKADKRPPSNFVFLIDVSGSMSPVTRLPLIKQSLRQLVKRMTENDRVAMVVYASSSGTVLESTSAVNKEVILAAIDRLEAGGSTNGGEGIQRAYDLAVANFIKGGVNRVLLCTDGDFNVGITDRGQLLRLIEEKAKSGVFLTTLGVGDDNFKDATLQQLADKGNGNYHYLDSVEEGHKVLVEQMNATLVTIAKDVKVQVDFNPAQVKAYRLIGYEKRILAKQDFNNDAKDAGEIGAGHTITALYEVCPVGVVLKTVGNSQETLESLKNLRATNSTAGAGSKYGPFSKLGDSMLREEYVYSKMQALERIAELAKTLRPSHPKMQELYKQLEDSEKLIRNLGPASKELLTLKLRYKAPDGDKSTLMEIPVTDSGAKLARASADFKFASAVASFGMVLKDSAFKGTASFDSALELAQEGKGDDTHGYRAEFINLLGKAKALKK
jgi:secreted protein with Ig-like and vWFA domain/anti-sigma factor RsiW